MNRSQIEGAIRNNRPFRIRMADGKEYRVPHSDYIFLSPKGTFVILFDEKDADLHYELPLLTMTGLVHEEAPAPVEGREP